MFRSRRRMKKSFYFTLFIIAFFSISVGYAFLSSTLSISGKSSINKNTWNLYFKNIKISEGSVSATEDPVIESSNKVSNFSFVLNTVGDYYEFSVDIVNDGTIDAMIDNIEKTPELTADQKKYLSYTIEYENGEQITTKQLVKSNEFVRIKVRVEYKKDITAADLPQTNQELNLGFNVNYIQAENSGVAVKDNGLNITPTANGSLDDIGTVVTIGSEKFYTMGTEGDNVKLLSMYNLYVGNEVTDVVVDNGSDVPVINALTNPTGMQSSKAKGFIVQLGTAGSLEPILPWIGMIPFSNEEKHGTNYNDYEGSIVEGYVNDYKNKLVDRFGVNVVEARLITVDELTDPNTFSCDSNGDCFNSTYPWIYSTSYWTNTSYDGQVFAVASLGFFEDAPVSDDFQIGVRPVIVMPKSDIVVETKPVANGNINKIGTVVTIGTEQFYTIGTEGNNVKLLSMYNLMVGNVVLGFDSENDVFGMLSISNSSNLQSNKAVGSSYDMDNLPLPFPWFGTTPFSNTSAEYSGSIVEGYVNNYKSLLENKFNLDIVEARMISRSELKDNETFACVDNDNCSDKYPWIYSTSYWTLERDGSFDVWFIDNSGFFGSSNYDNDSDFGVRPVIVISKSYFE